MSLVALDGQAVSADESLRCDVVVVGSGPGGASAARSLAEAGVDVVVVEEGRWVQPHEFHQDALASLSDLYVGAGFAFARGRSPMQLLYGRALGGTSVVNSGICWRLPRDVYDEWVTADPALAEALPWDALDRAAAEIETLLSVGPTDPQIAGANNMLMARGAEQLGLAHQPTRRNVLGCQGLGRCNEGCPVGAKLSMDRSLLPAAAARGARILTSVRVDEILRRRGMALGVAGKAAGGGRVRVMAERAVVLAAGAINTPALLLGNRIGHGPVGRRFQAHPGLAVAGLFPEPVRAWTGATQGHEVTGLMPEGIKLEAVAFDLPLIAYRLDSIGSELATDIGQLSHWATWAAGIRTNGMGSVSPGRKRAKVRFDLTTEDFGRVKRAVRALGELMFAAGAKTVAPGVAGWHRRVFDPETMARFEAEAPSDPRSYSLAISHMFGTCKLGSDPETSVVGPDFRHHAVDHLYVADASAFPTNLGVNPQLSIMAMAACCAQSITGPSTRDELAPAR